MKKRSVFAAALLSVLFASFLIGKEPPLLSQRSVEPYGLTRVWFHQLKIDPNRGKIDHILLEGGNLFIVSNDAKLHVLNAETGQWLWTRSLGKRSQTLAEPAVNSRIVAVHNGLEVFLCSRKTGKLLLQIPLPGAASAACEMSERYVYVPLMNGTIAAFYLDDGSIDLDGSALRAKQKNDAAEEIIDDNPAVIEDEELKNIVKQFEEAKSSLLAKEKPVREKQDIVLRNEHRVPILCVAFGTILTKPILSTQVFNITKDGEDTALTHNETLTWITDKGYLYSATVEALSMRDLTLRYRIDSAAQSYFLDNTKTSSHEVKNNKTLVSRPALNQVIPVNEQNPKKVKIPSTVVTGSRSAYVFAVDSLAGTVLWRFLANGQIVERIGIVGTEVYAPTVGGGMHAIDLDSGEEKWLTLGLTQFVASSQERLYAMDYRNRLAILDRKTGTPIHSFDVQKFEHRLFNVETDQIFLISGSGLIQCLRERQPQIDGNEPAPTTSLRHRLSCAEYAAVARGEPAPKLWWVPEFSDEEAAETQQPVAEKTKTTKVEKKDEGEEEADEPEEEPEEGTEEP